MVNTIDSAHDRTFEIPYKSTNTVKIVCKTGLKQSQNVHEQCTDSREFKIRD